MVGQETSVLVLQRGVCLLQTRVLVLEGSAAQAFASDILFIAFQASIGVGQTILEDALEASLGVALLSAAAFVVFETAFAAAEAILEQESSEGEGGGDDGSAADGVPEEIRVHGWS